MLEEEESLKHAKEQLLSSGNATEREQALEVIAAASALTESRQFLQDEHLFGKLLDILKSESVVPRPSRNLLRCIGNLLSDNDTNRAALVTDREGISILSKALLEYDAQTEDTDIEDFVVKVFFNLCNDSPDIQQQAFTQNIDIALVSFMSTRKWEPKDEVLFSISASLLASLYETKPTAETTGKYTAEFVGNVLGLPLLPKDPDTVLDLLSVACVLLHDEKFLSATLQSKHLHSVWSLLELVDGALRGELDEDDQKHYRQYLNAISQSMADISSMSIFNEEYTLDDDFIQLLCDKCIPSEEKPTSIIPGCACLMLGNLAIDDTTTMELASRLTSIDELFEHLGKSDESVFLNAAAGLLRHLAIPKKTRQRLFSHPLRWKQIAHLYTDVTLEQIQVAGLQLTRQIFTGMPGTTDHFISKRRDGEVPDLNTFLTLYSQTTSTATKLEISRLITALLKALQLSADRTSCGISLERIVMTPDVLTPCIFATKQSPEPGTRQAQADAWLALNIIARVPGGANVLAMTTSEDEEFFSALRQRLGGASESAPVTEGAAASGGEETRSEDSRPAWVWDKERDNAIVLVHDVLKSEDVDVHFKDRLRSLLGEREIAVRWH